MAAASLIATALGIVLILLTAYFLAGGALSAIAVVSDAQKDMTALQVKMLGTSMEINSSTIPNDSNVTIQILNNGRESIRDFKYMEIYLYDSSQGWSFFSYSTPPPPPSTGHWTRESITPDNVYPNQWDPGELLTIIVSYSGIAPNYAKIVTSNGIIAGSPLPYSRS